MRSTVPEGRSGLFGRKTRPDKDVDKMKENADRVIAGLQQSYFGVVKPLEEGSFFHEFHATPLGRGDFEAKPMVLLIGQYSTGKTSFIRYLLGRDFPGQRIGPEPTTDRFMAIQYGTKERVVPGNAAAAQSDKPWSGLQQFGADFLTRFECSEVDAPVLQEMTFVDTPGILSGEKQRLQRGYDFVRVTKWFAERADKILLLFDAHKLDISDEFKRTIEAIAFAHNKISVVLNKADMVSHQELMRVYGALMWSLGKVVQTPEVARVYVSSFWDQAKTEHVFLPLFVSERDDLLRDLRLLPKAATMSKVNEVVKRCRRLKVHMLVLDHLRAQMPSFMGKQKKANELVQNLDQVFAEVQRKYGLPVGDFPNLEQFREQLRAFDFNKIKKMDKVDKLDSVLSVQVPALIEMMAERNQGKASNPFEEAEAGLRHVAVGHEWAVSESAVDTAKQVFSEVALQDGRASGQIVKAQLLKTNVDPSLLREVWNLASIDGQGALDVEEFAVALHLTEIVRDGGKLPAALPLALVPPSKRQSPLLKQ